MTETVRWILAIGLIVGGAALTAATADFSAPPTETELLVANIARYVTFIVGGAVVALTVLVVSVYASVFRLYRRRLGPTHWRGLLPRHVIAVSISYTMMIVGSIADVASRVDQPITWRAPVYMLTYLLGVWAMWDVLGHSRHRYIQASKGSELS